LEAAAQQARLERRGRQAEMEITLFSAPSLQPAAVVVPDCKELPTVATAVREAVDLLGGLPAAATRLPFHHRKAAMAVMVQALRLVTEAAAVVVRQRLAQQAHQQ